MTGKLLTKKRNSSTQGVPPGKEDLPGLPIRHTDLWRTRCRPCPARLALQTEEEIAPWHEHDELWKVLPVTYPPDIASHSRQQDFYFGSDFLLRRHDYHVEASGGFAAAQYVFEPVTVQGITVPTKRRAYMRDPFCP